MAVSRRTALPAATRRAAGPSSALRTGTVAAVAASGVTVTVAGQSIVGLSYLQSYAPQVGDVVSLYAQDSSWLVLGLASDTRGQWTAFGTLESNLVQSGSYPLSYRLDGMNNVQVFGEFTIGSTAGSGIGVATMPVGFYNVSVAPICFIFNRSSGAMAWLQLSTGGQLQLHGTYATGNVMTVNAFYPIDHP